MKKLIAAIKLAIVFAAGTLSGIFIRLGFSVAGSRPRSPGGEVLILPLIVLLIIAGYWAGAEFNREAAYRKGYRDGSINLLRLQRLGREQQEAEAVLSDEIPRCKVGR